MIVTGAPHNSDARQDINKWPLPIIVGFCYTSAVLLEWGHESFLELMREKSAVTYYGGGTEGNDDDDDDASGVCRPQVSRQPTDRTIKESRRSRNERHDRRSANKAQAIHPENARTCEDMFDVVLALWMQSAREAARQRCRRCCRQRQQHSDMATINRSVAFPVKVVQKQFRKPLVWTCFFSLLNSKP